MNEPASGSENQVSASPCAGGPWESGGQTAVANGVFVGVGGVYAATGSVPVAGIAGVAAVLSIWLEGRRDRRPAARESGNDAAG